MVRFLKVVLPESVCVLLLPLKITVPVPGVNVPLLLQLAPTLTVAAVPTSKVPALIVRVPFKVRLVVLPPTLNVCPVLLTVRLLNVWLDALPPILWGPLAFWKVTVPVPGVNVPPLLIQLPPERLIPCDPGES